MPAPEVPASDRSAHVEHNVGRVRVRVDGSSFGVPEGRRSHGAFFDAPVSWDDAKTLLDAAVPGVGVVLDVSVRRAGLMRDPRTSPLPIIPAGFHIRLITAADS